MISQGSKECLGTGFKVCNRKEHDMKMNVYSCAYP